MRCTLGREKEKIQASPDENSEVKEEWEEEFDRIYKEEIKKLDTLEHARLDAIESKRAMPVDTQTEKSSVAVLKVKDAQTIPNKVSP